LTAKKREKEAKKAEKKLRKLSKRNLKGSYEGHIRPDVGLIAKGILLCKVHLGVVI
jgi:hypothetical protein